MFYYDEHNRMLSYYKYLPNITSTVCGSVENQWGL